MTVQNTAVRKAGPTQGNGVTTVFPFSFKVFSASDVLVTYLNLVGVPGALVLNTDYTVALNVDQNASPGGSITLLNGAPLAGSYITITSQVTYTQNLALTNSGGFYPTSINDALDRMTILSQQLYERSTRSIMLGVSTLANLTLASAVPGSAIGWDSGGNIVNIALSAGTGLVNLGAATGATLIGWINGATGSTQRSVASKLIDVVSVKDFGATGNGVTDDTTAFNLAAAATTTGEVLIPAGSYVISSPTTPAVTWMMDGGATILGLTTLYGGMQDTTRLTGRVVKRHPAGSNIGLRVGTGTPWLEKNYRLYSESIAECAVISGTGQIGILGASECSDNLPSNWSCIGVSGYGINNNSVNYDTAWAGYFEARRLSTSTGPAYGIEIDTANFGTVYNLTPQSNLAAQPQTVPLWIASGAGAPSVTNSSCAMYVLANGAKFQRGIVMQDGALDLTINEALTAPAGARVAWYSAGSLVAYLTSANGMFSFNSDSSGLGYSYIRGRANGTSATLAVDTVCQNNYFGYSGSANYLLGMTQCIQRGTFSGGNARGSYDIQATNDDGTICQVSLNGFGNKTFAPYPDNTLSLGAASQRWTTVYATTSTINTSDARLKREIRDINDQERQVAVKIKSMMKMFKLADSVDEKGSKARIHTGILAQDVREAFKSEGLDPNIYGMNCFDEWEYIPEIKNEDGHIIQHATQPGNRYGVRYEELLSFIISAL